VEPVSSFFSFASLPLVGARSSARSPTPRARPSLSLKTPGLSLSPSKTCPRQICPPNKHQKNSYDDNGGTCVAVAGADYAIVAASTRMASGFSILTRKSTKMVAVSPKVVVASAGFAGDAATLHKVLKSRDAAFRHAHGGPMSVVALAQLLSNTLYHKRFFPYFTFNLAVGLDNEGKGAVYAYDAIGSYERTGYSCQGTGKDLIQPVLDNQLKADSPLLVPARESVTALPAEAALDLVKAAFVAAGERDIYTGDAVEILVIKAGGIERHELELKKD
jgi:20S proteasome subunit beta 6